MIMINECLDQGDWTDDTPDKLKMAEVAAWYGDTADTVVDSDQTKIKKKSKSKSKNKRKSIDESITDSDSVSLPASKKAKEGEDEWRESINSSLAALAGIVQQLAKSKSDSQEEIQPPVPPRSQEQLELIQDVRQFVKDNPAASTPNRLDQPADKSVEIISSPQVESEETCPKQRALPSGRIPKKPVQYTQSKQTASGNGNSQFQFSHTYADFENCPDSDAEYEQQQLDDQIVDDQIVDDREEDPDAALKEMDLGRLEKRKMHLKGLPNMVPDLQFTQPQAPKTGRFEFLYQKPKENHMPFLTEMLEQISIGSVVGDRKPRDPFNLFPKFYPTSEPAESGALQLRTVPRELVNLVDHDKLVTQGTSGRKAIIRNAIADGAKEEAAKVSFKQSCGYIRMANNLEIDVEVMQKLMSQISTIVSDLDKIRGVPVAAKAKILQLNQKIRLMNNTVFDVKSTNSDLALGALFQYQSSLFDRRAAWLSASMVLKGTAAELRGADFPRPSQSDEVGRLSMFGPQGSQVMKEYDELAQNGKVPTPRPISNSSSRSRQPRGGQYGGRFNNQFQSFGHGRGQPHFRGQGHRARGGRPANRRPRNNYRGGRSDRGQYQPQPFSHPNKPQNRQ
jgi:hypothetical protein